QRGGRGPLQTAAERLATAVVLLARGVDKRVGAEPGGHVTSRPLGRRRGGRLGGGRRRRRGARTAGGPGRGAAHLGLLLLQEGGDLLVLGLSLLHLLGRGPHA